MTNLLRYYHQIQRLSGRIINPLRPIADLIARLYIAQGFLSSGLLKLHDWNITLYLFTDEYHVPLISPASAAITATVGELGLSVLLAFGLLTRFAAAGLFIVNAVAVIAYYHALKDSPAALQDHAQWAMMLGLILVAKTNICTRSDNFLAKWLPPSRIQ